MNHSSERMLTTHTGSLARPLELIQAMQLKERGQDYDTEAYAGLVRQAVADVVDLQVDAGVDIIYDGEDFDKAVQLDPDYASAYYSRGVAYGYLGEYSKADADNAKACSLDSQWR